MQLLSHLEGELWITGTGTAASLCTHGDRSHVEMPASRNTDTDAATPSGDSPQGLTEILCFSCGNYDHRVSRCPTLDIKCPHMLPVWLTEKRGDHYAMISPRLTAERLRAGNGGMEGQPPGSVNTPTRPWQKWSNFSDPVTEVSRTC